MTKNALKFISDSMAALELEYGLGEYSGNAQGQIVYPYFVGEYNEAEPLYENGETETTFMLTGFSRGSWETLENAKAAIERHFRKISGRSAINEDGSVIIVFYTNALIVPQNDMELKCMQINLKIIEWSVI